MTTNRKDYVGTMETMVEYSTTAEMSHMLRFLASLPQAQTAKAALLNAAYRLDVDNRFHPNDAGYDFAHVKMDGREG